jgi:hypothetical protein
MMCLGCLVVCQNRLTARLRVNEDKGLLVSMSRIKEYVFCIE